MLHLRPAYTPPLMSLVFGRTRVGAATEAQVPPKPGVGDSARTALYIGLPALASGALAHLAGWVTPVVLLAAGAGGLGGYIASTLAQAKAPTPTPPPLAWLSRDPEDAGLPAAAKIEAKLKVVEDAAATAATAEKDRRAKLDVTEVVVDATEPLVTQVATALLTFTVATTSGVETDYGSALFPLKPTDVTVKMLDDTAAALSAAGYVKAQGQIAAAAGAAKTARDAP